MPYRLSHRGVVIELNLKLGATHISLARFLVAPNYVWVPLYMSQSPCVCANSHILSKRKFQKNHGELNPRCLHELPLHYHLSHTGLSIRVIILPKRCSKLASKREKITQKWPKRAKGCALSKPRQYFNGEPRKKELIFLQKNFCWPGIEPGTFA